MLSLEEIEKLKVERSVLASNCRNGKQLSINFTEWSRYHEGYLEGFDACMKLMLEREEMIKKSIQKSFHVFGVYDEQLHEDLERL